MTNPFGGKNALSLYIPMSDIEQELISRLCEAGDLQVLIHGWGYVDNPKVTAGDHQVVIPIDITFTAPDPPIPVHHFDLELRTYSGITLFREQQSALYGNQPIMVGAGTHLQMIWHVGIRAMDPKLVKLLMPGVRGLTSRTLDKDTGNITLTGNMHLNTAEKRMAEMVRSGEATVRADNAHELARARKQAG